MATNPNLPARDIEPIPGTVAPADGNVPKPAPQLMREDYGPNFEKLQELRPDLVNALRELEKQFRLEGVAARRNEIRRVRKARMFFQGSQYGWWNPQDMTWHLPFDSRTTDTTELQDGPRYQNVTNLFQAFGLSFIAVISQDVPEVKFFPQSAQSPADISAAKAASKASDLIEQNNQVAGLLTNVGFYLWTDGKIGGYVRYVADGQRFGWKQMEDLEAVSVPFGQNTMSCPSCGASKPADGSGFGPLGMICQDCGSPMSQDATPPQVQVPRVSQTRRMPNGQEVISIIGGLELNTPVWANEMHEYPYLQWAMEVHRSKLKAAYPHAADKIQVGAPQGADDVYARAARVAVSQGAGMLTTHPGDALTSLITFSRTWIRPWAFYAIEDKTVRDALLEMFADGCYVGFAGDTYCEARCESMDDCWRVMHALPGDGQSRPSVGDSLVEIQEQYNAVSNIQSETYEYGIPPIYADPQVLDFDALNNQIAEPAAHYPARARPGQPLAAGFFQPAPAQVAPDMIAHKQELMGQTAQFLTGMFPAIFGGDMEDVKTASGYAMARDQALGRLGLVWRRVKAFYADVMMLSVDCFRKNRPEDVETPVLGEAGEFESEFIKLADLKGNIQVHPESDESFPRLKSQQRGALQSLMSMAGEDPALHEVLSDPDNMDFIRQLTGLTELVIPGADSRDKQLREIQQMLKGVPVQIDQFLDDHAAELESCKRWANSEAGQLAKMRNPAGFAAVREHAQFHEQVLQSQQQQPAQKPPSEAISFKDLPPDGQAQMAKQAGIELNPADLQAKQIQDRQDKADEMHAKLNAKAKPAPSGAD